MIDTSTKDFPDHCRSISTRIETEHAQFEATLTMLGGMTGTHITARLVKNRTNLFEVINHRFLDNARHRDFHRLNNIANFDRDFRRSVTTRKDST